MIEIMIADDHVLVRRGLKQLLETMEDVRVVMEACNGAEVLAALHETHPDLLLLDLSMPGINGIELIRQICAQYEKVPILVLSMHTEVEIAKRALRAGAMGFLTKGADKETLTDAVRRVAAGGHYVDPAIVDLMMFDGRGSMASLSHDCLSKRELEILVLLANGRSLNEIADELDISNKTVSTHKTRLMQKMNFKTNAELVSYAAEAQIIL